jgi:hypothetical protein
VPVPNRACHDAVGEREEALAAARELLISSADAVHPGLSARTMLKYLIRYRQRLAALVAVTDPVAPIVRTVDQAADALIVSPWEYTA